MDGFQKINPLDSEISSLQNQEANPTSPKQELKSKGGRKGLPRKIAIPLIVILILAIFSIFTIILPAKNTYTAAQETYTQVKQAWQAVKNQDLAKADEEIKTAQIKLKKVDENMKPLAWTKYVPYFGGYTRDAEHLLRAGSAGLEAGQITIEAIEPYSDVLGLKGQGSFVGGSAEERIQKAVQAFDKVTPKLSEVNAKMKLVKEEVDQIDHNRYPKSFRNYQIRDQIVGLKNNIDGAQKILTDAQPLLEVLPSLMGEPSEKKYLILFQNDKELRATGGFLTAYAVFRFEHGKMVPESSDDIYNLDKRKTKRLPAPEPILKYLPLVSELNLRDSNLSPDFEVSAKSFEELYGSIPQAPKIDGIITIDTHVLLKIMEVLGPIPAYGTNFTTDIISACNCPQVIYELERFADQPVGYERGSRKDMIGVLMSAIMNKALGVSPREYWGKLFQVGLSEINEKHILFYFHNEKAQKGAAAVNMSGKIRDFDGDYLHINDTNFAGAKSNMYVQHKVEQKIEVGGDGTATKTLILTYKNPQAPSDCNLERGGLCLNGILRNWVRIYVPKDSKLLESQGSEVEMYTQEDLGKTVFNGFLKVNPLGSSQLVVKYQLPFKVEKGKELKELIQKQPGTDGHEYVVIVNGKKVEEFPLKTDKELKLKI